jgi:Kef-type K+ transport system membrane component KefB
MATSDFEFAFLLIGVFLTLIKGSQVVSRRFGLPDVLGELVTGIIMGPTVLGILYLKNVPSSSLSDILHVDQYHIELTATVINFISEFAVLLLLFKVGMEVDFDDLKRVKTPAFITASLGIVLPLIGGFFLIYGVVSLASLNLIPDGIDYVNASIFLGATLTATSIGISTRLFLDMDKMRTKVAQTVVGSAIIDDIIAVALFSVIVAYFGDTQDSGILFIIINIVIFFIVSFILFKYGIPYFMSKTKRYSDSSVPVFVSIAFMLYMAVFAQFLGLAPIIGAFVAGVIIGNEEGYLDIHRDFEPITSWIIPFFFLDIGLSVNLGDVLDPQAFLIAMVIVIVAVLSKFIAGFVGTYFQGYTKGEARTTGLSMAARGEVTLIFAFTGYSYGYFSELFYGIIILSVVLIIFILIPTMKYAVKKWLPELEYAPISGD